MISWLHCFWVVVLQNVMVEGQSGGKLLTIQQSDSRESEGKGQDQDATFRGMPQ